jgi:outer membrane protein assembly factor BamE
MCGIVLAASLLSACNILAPYRAEVQQGNVVTQEMIAKLQPGMTRSQVRFALGTPLVRSGRTAGTMSTCSRSKAR